MSRKRKIECASNIEEVKFHFDEDSRFVEPYVHEFSSYAKGRWLGREVIDVTTKEFGSHSQSYWERAIKLGFIRINGQVIDRSYKFKNNDKFTHLTHRHEPPGLKS